MRAVVVLTALAVAAPVVAQDAAVKELDGGYTVKEFARAGKPVPDEVRKTVTAVTVAGGKLTVKVGGKELTAALKADPKKSPAELDLFPQGADYEKGKRFPGLYKVEKGELTIVFVEEGDRPKDFATETGTATRLVLVKK
jgi:uncharacterized protein (TIGR03067 family)